MSRLVHNSSLSEFQKNVLNLIFFLFVTVCTFAAMMFTLERNCTAPLRLRVRVRVHARVHGVRDNSRS